MQHISGPNVAPERVRGYNTSSTALLVHWDPIPPLGTAVVVGYLVRVTSLKNTSKVHTALVDGSDASNVTVKDLGKYTNYSVVVLGRSATYHGVESRPVFLHTDIPGKIKIIWCLYIQALPVR